MTDWSIPDAVARVRERVAAAAERSGRSLDDVRIVAATKTVEVARIEQAVQAGINELGENRAKDLDAKAHALPADVCWHFLGAVQTNKVRMLDGARIIQSLDRIREAEVLQARAEATDSGWDALIEVNLAAEPQKQGVAPGDVEPMLEAMRAYPLVRVRGLMFVAPQVENVEDVRWVFVEGRRLREKLAGHGLDELSMGMTEDFEVAVEEGATIVRIGRAIFGPRRQD